MKKSMSTIEIFAKRLKDELNISVENIRRTYAGRRMRASGAPSWRGNIIGSGLEVNGTTPISRLINAKTLLIERCISGYMEIVEKQQYH